MPSKTFCMGFVILAAGLSSAPARSAPPEDPEEFKIVAVRLVRENCLICHSAELIAGQRLAPGQWKAEVEKMAGWGSPILKDEQAIVSAYLAETYPVSRPPVERERISVSAAYAPFRPSFTPTTRKTNLTHGKATYDRDCANCHGTDAQGADLGSNLLDRASLWRDADLARVVREGRGRMPAFTRTIDDLAYDDLVAWLRSRKYKVVLPK